MSVAEDDEGHSWAKVPCVLIRWEAPPKATFLVNLSTRNPNCQVTLSTADSGY